MPASRSRACDESAGDSRGAAASRTDALHLYELKGATEQLRRLRGTEPAVEPTATPATAPAAAHRSVAAGSRSPYAENASATTLERGWRLVVAGQLDEFAVLNSHDVAQIDRRSVVAGDLHGREHILASARAFVDLGLDAAHAEVLAVRGSKLTLARVTLGFGNTSEIMTLQLLELDDNGLVSRYVFFDEHDLDAAIYELDQRYLAGEGSVHAQVLRPAQALLDAGRRHDFEAMAGLLSSDFVSVDHRPLAFGDNDRDHFLSAARTITEIGLREISSIVRVVYVVGRAVLAVQHGRRVTDRGAWYEWDGPVVALFDPSYRVCRIEYYAADDFDRAVARLDELGSADRRTPFARNSAVRQAERLVACFNARDFDGARLLIGHDFARFDRRHGVSAPTADGVDAYMDAARAWFDVGFDELVLEPLAVRGESLMLSRGGYRVADGREVMFLVVYELDGEGLIARGTHFDEDELVAAVDELDERYLAGEGAPYARMVNGRRALVRALAQGDEAAKQHFAPGFEFVDHRALSWPLTDAEGWIEMTRQLDMVVSNGALIVRTVHFAGRAELVSADFSGTTDDGSEYAWSTHVVALYDEQGRTLRRENFPRNSSPKRSPGSMSWVPPRARRPADLDNAALRMIMAGGAPETAFADDVVIDDRRTGVSLPQLQGSEAAVRVSRAQNEIFGPTVMEPVAARGDRLGLVRTRTLAESGFELVAYGVFETNDSGQIVAMTFYDDDGLEAALAELDLRYFSGEGAAHAEIALVAGRFMAASRRDEFDAMRELMTPDFVIVDHRPLGYGVGDREYFIDLGRTRTQVSANGVQVARRIVCEGDGLLVVGEENRITEHGGEYGAVFCIVQVVDTSKRLSRIEWFSEEEYDDALARLHELAATPQATIPTLDNAAMAGLRRVNEIAERNDLGEIESLCEELCTEDIERLDHRAGVAGMPLRGRAEIVRLFHETFTVFPVLTFEPIAVRGDLLAVARVQMASSQGFAIRLVGLYEGDTTGRLAFFAHYDENDVGDALAELDRRYIAGKGARHADVLLAIGAFNARSTVTTSKPHARGWRPTSRSSITGHSASVKATATTSSRRSARAPRSRPTGSGSTRRCRWRGTRCSLSPSPCRSPTRAAITSARPAPCSQ